LIMYSCSCTTFFPHLIVRYFTCLYKRSPHFHHQKICAISYNDNAIHTSTYNFFYHSEARVVIESDFFSSLLLFCLFYFMKTRFLCTFFFLFSFFRYRFVSIILFTPKQYNHRKKNVLWSLIVVIGFLR
jgi:hypothetical protein